MLTFSLALFLLISIVLSAVGLGGGAFYVPLLSALGYPFSIASSTSLFLIMLTGLSAFTRFQKAKLVDWQLALFMDFFTDLGAFAGGYTAVRFAPVYLRIAFGVVLIIAAYFIFKMQKQKGKLKPSAKKGLGYWQRDFGEEHYSLYLPAVFPITFAIGYLSGALGIAGGLLKIPIMVLWFSVPLKIAVATSSLMVGLTGLLGFGGHLFTGQVDWKLALALGLIVIIGGQIGARFSIKMEQKKLKQILALVLVITAGWMILKGLIT
ncbi:sulfite exporter TauE/SafE family protein [candidate division KSB1 bacterium]|nr:MAG: sulfite exporter TauE/SafE family protein [candidate division KSB1 bacterium]